MAAQANPNQPPTTPPYIQDYWDLGLGIAAISYLLSMVVLCLILLISGWPIATEKKQRGLQWVEHVRERPPDRQAGQGAKGE